MSLGRLVIFSVSFLRFEFSPFGLFSLSHRKGGFENKRGDERKNLNAVDVDVSGWH